MVRVLFLHPDLGIGGAERLVVDAALALKSKGHTVHFVTSHHDPCHCFEETRDGSLPVTSIGDWLPRSFLGKFYALCAYLRMIYVAIYVSLFFSSQFEPDVIFCDQISACIPFLRVPNNPKIIFYCHFPDQLLTQRRSWLKSLYRKPIDWIEEKTTGMADVVLVNSKFTAGVFHDTFRSLSVVPDVLYPSLNTDNFDKLTDELENNLDTITFLSINRYERKKNLPLAIEAFRYLKSNYSLPDGKTIRLVIAGGYDSRVAENIDHFNELSQLVEDLDFLPGEITFMKSPSDSEKLRLLKTSQSLIYTPSGEHFGIVPIEAMYSQLPVIAVNNGGPTETVLDGQTGYLCEPSPENFAEAMFKIVKGGHELKELLGNRGHRHIKDNFAFKVFAQKLDNIVRKKQP